MPVVNTMKNYYVGGSQVKRVYAGTNLVWSQPAPKALVKFTAKAPPYWGNVGFDAQTTLDPNLTDVIIYLSPTGVPLDRVNHAKKTFPVTQNTTFVLNYGDPTIPILPNYSFTAAMPPPTTAPGFSVASGQLLHNPTPQQAMVSSDGITWVKKDTPFDPGLNDYSFWFRVCRAESPRNLFAAVSNNGSLTHAIMTSPNGDVWTPRSVPESIALNSIAYSPALGMFVAVGFSAGAVSGCRMFSSTDGITWSPILSAPSTQLAWRDICWSPERGIFLAVSQTSSTSAVITSNDGVTWARRSSAGQGQWQSCVWCPNLNPAGTVGVFVIAGNSGVFRIAHAPNPVSAGFVGVTLGFDTNFFPRCLGYSPTLNRVVAGGNSGSVRVAYSDNGATWTDITATCGLATDEQWGDIQWIGDKFVMVSNDNVATSPDGLTWTYRTPDPNHPVWYKMAYSTELDRVVAVSQAYGIYTDRAGWDMASANGDVIRSRIDSSVVTNGSLSLRVTDAANVGVQSLGSQTSPGNVLNRTTLTVVPVGAKVVVQCSSNNTSVVSEIAAFKETALCAPQGTWDIHAFPRNLSGVEGPEVVIPSIQVV